MLREITCIVCPNGCDLTVEYNEDLTEIKVSGNICKRGEEYARQELTAPKRTIASSVKVEGGALPLVSVRINNPIPKDKIFDVMQEISKIKVQAPTHIGDVVIENVLGLGSDVIITKNVEAMK